MSAPFPERIIIAELLADAAITDIVDRRVGSELPAKPVFPALRVTLLTGSSVDPESDHVEASLLQVDAWADTQEAAFVLIAAVRARLRGLTGTQDANRGGGVVSAVRLGARTWAPDDSYVPARSRYTQDITVYAHA